VAGEVAEDRVLPGLQVDLELVGLAAAGLELEARHLPTVEHQRVLAALALQLDGVDPGRRIRVLRVEEEVAALDVERLLRRAFRLLVARPSRSSAAAGADDRGSGDRNRAKPCDATSPHPTLTVACIPAAR
jgi:hypothetical protein